MKLILAFADAFFTLSGVGWLRQHGRSPLRKALINGISATLIAIFKSFDPQEPGRMGTAVTMIVHANPPPGL